jgi:hypothetical protein
LEASFGRQAPESGVLCPAILGENQLASPVCPAIFAAMNPHTLRLRLGLFAVLAGLILSAAGVRADDKPAGASVFYVNVPSDKLSAKDVHDVVVAASIGRGWTVKSDDTAKVVIYLNHRKHEATVTYVISEKRVDTYSDGYVLDGNGNRKKPEQPESWLKYLKEDITRGLQNKAALAK